MPNFKNTYIPIDAPDYPTCTTYVIADVNLNTTPQPVPYKNSNGDTLYIQVGLDGFQKNFLRISQKAAAAKPTTTELVKADKARAYRIIGEFLDAISKPPRRPAKKKSKKK